jgi:hypothetical protein
MARDSRSHESISWEWYWSCLSFTVDMKRVCPENELIYVKITFQELIKLLN